MSVHITPPGAHRAGKGLIIAAGVVSIALAAVGLQIEYTQVDIGLFVGGGIISLIIGYLIHQDSILGWGSGLIWVSLFVWLQFWYTTLSEGALPAELLVSLHLLTLISVLSLAIFVENRKYYWEQFKTERSDTTIILLLITTIIGLLGSVYVPGTLFSTNWTRFLDLLLSGLGQGSLYAFPTIGFVLIYKSTDILNFAQGILVVLGSYSVLIFTDWGFSIPVALGLSLVMAVLTGLFLERFLFRKFIGEPELSVVLVTIALISVIGGVVQAIIGGETYQGYPDALLIDAVSIPYVDLTVRSTFVIGIFGSAVLLVLLVTFFKYTVIGTSLRAAASDQQAATLMGISISQTIRISWVLSIAITMIGGVLLAMSLGGATFQIQTVIILVFAAAIFGGLDSLVGAFLGSLTVGTLEILAGFYFTPIYGSGFSTVLPMLFLLGVLIVKPYGLFGTERIERL